ncbi:MAG: 3-methyl-2-oxobutanoate hydroxymethyltransferase [Flavobacteriia bacterium]|nr:3-methyl-2-oxobutanoate hydroxymethyltransferase [Flavobacteriia bacterium]
MSKAKKTYSRITTKTLQEMKANGEKISMLTAYDYTLGMLVDQAGIDVILVGDSASNVMAGGTYQADSKEALRSAIRIMKESGAHAVKLEGGVEVKESIERILRAGIPVMGHLGLTPQSIYKFGSYTVRAKEEQEAKQLLEEVKMLETMGCFGVVLEKIPATLAGQAAKSISIPIIGIGAGPEVDGQVLVLHDMLGMNKEFSPRFLRRYLDLDQLLIKAISQYSSDVKSLNFPNKDEQY